MELAIYLLVLMSGILATVAAANAFQLRRGRAQLPDLAGVGRLRRVAATRSKRRSTSRASPRVKLATDDVRSGSGDAPGGGG